MKLNKTNDIEFITAVFKQGLLEIFVMDPMFLVLYSCSCIVLKYFCCGHS